MAVKTGLEIRVTQVGENQFVQRLGTINSCPSILKEGDKAIVIGKIRTEKRFTEGKEQVLVDDDECAVEIPWEMIALAQ